MNLGNYGRLGNQMFQYAAMLGISEKTGYEFGFNPGRLLDCFEIKRGLPLRQQVQAKFLYFEPDFKFSSVVFDCPDEVDFIGYFQSEKYWAHCRDKVLEQFKFLNKNEEIPQSFTSLHIRRGDYTNLKETHTCLAETDYYDLALQFLKPQRVVVFTDDKEWFINSDLIKRWGIEREVVVDDSTDDVQSLQQMSKASDAIIANSSFSWWGAYLGPHQGSGKIVAPLKWFGPQGPQDWRDIYCEGWVKI